MSPEHVVVAPVLVPLSAAVLTLLVRPWPRVQRGLSVLGGFAYLAAVGALVSVVWAEGTLVYALSGWQAPVGIVLVADALSAFFLAFAAVLVAAALVASAWGLDEGVQRLAYHPLFHFMVLGVTGSFLTGDFFNLFVWFEVMLMSTYVLVVFFGGARHTRAALYYAFLNLVGGALMLVAVGGIYATTGTLNMADVARRLADPAAFGMVGVVPAVLGLSAVLFAVFALKAGVVPFQFWVPEAYRAAPAPVAAVMAGVTKKVGIYAIIRVYFTVFSAASLPSLDLPGFAPTADASFLAFFGPVMFVLAAASVALGGVGAVDQPDVDGMLAYSSIGQIGFVVLPLAVAAAIPDLRALGIAAALVYALNHALAKGLLFLASGATFAGAGVKQFADLGGLAERDPALAGGFFVGALALVGIPPLTGFFGKFLVFDVAARAGSWLALAVALGGAVLTIAYVSRAWNRAFWGDPVPYRRDAGQVGVVVVLAVLLVALGVGFQPVLVAAEEAAAAALDRGAYVEAVLGRGSA